MEFDHELDLYSGINMGDDEVLTVRFYFNGKIVLDGSQMQYCNGDLGVSHID